LLKGALGLDLEKDLIKEKQSKTRRAKALVNMVNLELQVHEEVNDDTKAGSGSSPDKKKKPFGKMLNKKKNQQEENKERGSLSDSLFTPTMTKPLLKEDEHSKLNI
jgi:hypothetical protein